MSVQPADDSSPPVAKEPTTTPESAAALAQWYKDYQAAPGNDLYKDSALLQAVHADPLDASAIEHLIRASTPVVSVAGGFCARCRALFDAWPTLGASCEREHDAEPGEEEGWECAVAVVCSTVALEAAARAGCRFCAFVLLSLRDADVLGVYRRIEARLRRVEDGDGGHGGGEAAKCGLSIQNWGANPSQILWLNLPGKECTSCNSGIALSVNFDSCFLPADANCYEEPREVLDIARAWLTTCSEGHELCNSNNEGILPTRLISLATQPPRLVLTAELSESVRYATLSHCWGNSSIPKLTPENLGSYMQAISVESLPKTFRDAIMIARHLGLEYLWIDSLCIIQNEKDWQKEVGLMSSVYGGSTLNIAASSARDSTGGCFVKPAGFVGGLRARITDGGRKRVQDFRSGSEYERSTFGTPLGSRAWALQEKMLSPRTIHFSDRGAFWECRTKIGSEHLPDGFPRQLGSPLVRRSDKLVAMWPQIIRLYSGANLTFGNDKLPALSGIARQAHYETGDQYLAGLWRTEILEQLCWMRTRSKPLLKRPPWRAPTWTWASIDGEVYWRPTQEGILESVYAHVVDANTTIAGQDPFGQVSGGVIRLACSTMATGQLSHADPNDPKEVEKGAFTVMLAGNNKEKCTIQVDTLTDLERTRTAPIHLLPILGGETGSSQLKNGKDYTLEYIVEGIVLKATGGARGEFHRIGAFTFFKDSVFFGHKDDVDEDENTYNPFLEVLEQHGRATAEATCADVISNPEHPGQQFVITIV